MLQPSRQISCFCLFAVVLLLCINSNAGAKAKSKSKSSKGQEAPKDEDDPSQAHLAYGNNPLHDAARDEDIEFMKKILERTPGIFRDVRFKAFEYDDPEDYPTLHDKNDGGNTPLHLATWLNKKEAVKLLLKHGAPVNVRNRAGQYPIAWAARHNDTTILEIMLKEGASPNTVDEQGFAPLHFCAGRNAVEACRMLLDNGANINTATAKGHTPIFTASELHNTAVAMLLLERGANVKDLVDENGHGPLDLCSGRAASRKYDGLPHQVQLVEALREHGALYIEERQRKQGGEL